MNYRQTPMTGLTLLELMIVIAIATIIGTIGLPSLRQFNQNIEARADISQIRSAIMFARENAITKRRFTTVCGLHSGQCNKDWGRNLTIFEDQNQNRKIDATETILQRLPDLGSIYKEIGYNRTHLTYRPSGRSPSSAGSLIYCFRSQSPISKVYVIAASGRIRPGADKNKNGIPEAGNGRDVRCEPLTR